MLRTCAGTHSDKLPLNFSAKANIRSQLAAVLVEKGEFDSALKHINDALDNDPESGKFLYQKATIFMQMKEHENEMK